MQLNEFKKNVIRELKQQFSDKAIDFVVNRLNDEPHLDIEMEFTLYGYCIVGILIERRTVFFTVREGNVGLKLFKSTLISDSGAAEKARLGRSVLEQLDREVKLRIPDKYLREKYSI